MYSIIQFNRVVYPCALDRGLSSPTSASPSALRLNLFRTTTTRPLQKMSLFRPCIDLHAGQVKQIVGGTLDTSSLKTNFVSLSVLALLLFQNVH